jgi:hypothetical protein
MWQPWLLSQLNSEANMRTVVFLIFFSLPILAFADDAWVLKESTIEYSVSHPLHHVEGTSREARGKGVCHGSECNFLIGVLVKTFDSGDSNRDLHTIQVVRGAEFPLITVRTKLPADLNQKDFFADLEVEFAGQKHTYTHLPIHREDRGTDVHVVATIPMKIEDFKIEAPSLLSIPIKNDVPIRVDMLWSRQVVQ